MPVTNGSAKPQVRVIGETSMFPLGVAIGVHSASFPSMLEVARKTHLEIINTFSFGNRHIFHI
jgi:hypothetical protein